MNDYSWYLLGLLIMSLIFVCGYKIGSYFGWHKGSANARLIELQHRQAAWRYLLPQKGHKHWAYVPMTRKNGSSVECETAVPTMQEETK